MTFEHCHYRCAHLDGCRCRKSGRNLSGQRKSLACVQNGWEEIVPLPETTGRRGAFNTLAMASALLGAPNVRW